jgi:hypothetical protein
MEQFSITNDLGTFVLMTELITIYHDIDGMTLHGDADAFQLIFRDSEGFVMPIRLTFSKERLDYGLLDSTKYLERYETSPFPSMKKKLDRVKSRLESTTWFSIPVPSGWTAKIHDAIVQRLAEPLNNEESIDWIKMDSSK